MVVSMFSLLKDIYIYIYIYIYLLELIIQFPLYTLIVLAVLWIYIYQMIRKIFAMVKGISNIPVSLHIELVFIMT